MTQLYYYNQIIKLSADFELTDFESFHTVFCFLNILIGFKFTKVSWRPEMMLYVLWLIVCNQTTIGLHKNTYYSKIFEDGECYIDGLS